MSSDSTPNFARLAKAVLARLGNAGQAVRQSWHPLASRLLLPRVPGEDAANWLVVIHRAGPAVRKAATVILAREMARRGWHVKFVFQDGWCDHLSDPNQGIGGSLRATGMRTCTLVHEAPLPEIEVDYDRPSARVDDADFTDMLCATLSNLTRSYEPAWNDSETRPLIDQLLDTCRACLVVARRIRAAAAGKRIVILTSEINSLPPGFFTEYFLHDPSSAPLEIYMLEEAYTMYYGDRDTGLDLLLTKLVNTNPFWSYFCHGDEFEPWYRGLSEASHHRILAEARQVVLSKGARRRIGFHDDPRIVQKIAEARSAGRPVYCLFSHILYDRFVHDRSPAFCGMLDWIAATVEEFRHRDALLLIKPHPAELGILKDRPKQYLPDVVAALDPPDNVVVLPANQFLANELAQHLDAGIIWGSTAMVEMLFLGVPCLYCGPTCFYSEPLRLQAPASREAFGRALTELPRRKVDEELQMRAAAVLYLLNRMRLVPLEMMGQAPAWFPGDSRTIIPTRLLRHLVDGKYGLPGIADAVTAGKLAAIGPLASDEDRQCYP